MKRAIKAAVTGLFALASASAIAQTSNTTDPGTQGDPSSMDQPAQPGAKMQQGSSDQLQQPSTKMQQGSSDQLQQPSSKMKQDSSDQLQQPSTKTQQGSSDQLQQPSSKMKQDSSGQLQQPSSKMKPGSSAQQDSKLQQSPSPVMGVVTQVDRKGKALTIVTPSGQSTAIDQAGKELFIDQTTKFIAIRAPLEQGAPIMRDGKTASLSAIKEGDVVRTSFDSTGSTFTDVNAVSQLQIAKDSDVAQQELQQKSKLMNKPDQKQDTQPLDNP
jgi:hypothetical protein